MTAVHPVLYVFLAGAHDLEQEIKKRALSGAFFLTLPNDNADKRRSIQSVMAEIQRNEAGFNLKRVYIYMVVQSHKMVDDFESSDLRLIQSVFGGNSILPNMTLCALTYESLEPYDGDDMGYEVRAAKTVRFLSSLDGLSVFFNRTFLLSDRDENNTVHPKHWASIYEILSRLPLVHDTDSRLYEMLDARIVAEGRPLYLSAGIVLEAYPDISDAGMGIVSRFARNAFGVRRYAGTTPNPSDISVQTIVNQMQSVAANPVGIFQLRGLTLAEAETVLFGDRMERFFMEQYIYFLPETDFHGINKNNDFALPCKSWRIGTVIRKIAKAYARRYEFYRRQAQQAAEEHTRQTKIRCEETLARLHEAPSPPCAISLLRYDGLLDETHRFTDGGSNVLRIIGGFPVESLTLAGRHSCFPTGDFITQSYL
jgi:hypothetical protein